MLCYVACERPLLIHVSLNTRDITWIGKVRVARYELRVGAFCELRVDSEKCELVHLKCELRVG